MRSPSLLAALGVLATTGLAGAQEPPVQSNLEAGGLRPPEAVDSAAPGPTDPAAPSPEGELALADKEDSGRGLEWVWLNAEVGGAHLGLQTLRAKQLVDPGLIETTQTGLVYGAGLGVRVLHYTFGARFRLGTFTDWRLWTLNAEAGLHIPLGRLEPYVTLGAGYASVGAFSGSGPTAVASKAEVSGISARLGAGLDYYLSNTFSVGGNLTGDVLFLSRAAVSGAAAGTDARAAKIYAADGSSIGAGVTLTALLGLHF